MHTVIAFKPESAAEPVSTSKPTPTPAVPPPESTPTTADPEEEKRRKRAGRFGIQYQPARTAPTPKSTTTTPPVDEDKLKSSKKRASPQPPTEETDRKKKRAEKFGVETGVVDVDEEEEGGEGEEVWYKGLVRFLYLL
ncbi:hypothetical protein AAF712_013964 [Marasmius tenuissimus]|uniref:Uncharacterized protein n=1 Tax=Marasmius tenuissimus TaxID=585030 RepID=A0ABR2ZD99_9AGAR